MDSFRNTEFTNTDFTTLSEIGRALWFEAPRSERETVDTLSAVALTNLKASAALERAAALLLGRALGTGAIVDRQQNLAAMQTPFFRLGCEQRFVLTALHFGKWSYARIARVALRAGLQVDGHEAPADEIERMAWTARLELASSLGLTYPTGSRALGPRCPAYDPLRPWTQRFLDGELSTSGERIFLESHLTGCSACREALTLCRALYYRVEAAIPVRLEAGAAPVMRLAGAYRQGERLKKAGRIGFRDSLHRYLSHWDVRIALALLGVFATIAALRFR